MLLKIEKNIYLYILFIVNVLYWDKGKLKIMYVFLVKWCYLIEYIYVIIFYLNICRSMGN